MVRSEYFSLQNQYSKHDFVTKKVLDILVSILNVHGSIKLLQNIHKTILYC